MYKSFGERDMVTVSTQREQEETYRNGTPDTSEMTATWSSRPVLSWHCSLPVALVLEDSPLRSSLVVPIRMCGEHMVIGPSPEHHASGSQPALGYARSAVLS